MATFDLIYHAKSKPWELVLPRLGLLGGGSWQTSLLQFALLAVLKKAYNKKVTYKLAYTSLFQKRASSEIPTFDPSVL